MRNILAISICLLVKLIAITSFAQKKIVVLGSSTAAGNGASVDSSWVARLWSSFRKNMSDGADTIIDNRAYPGYVTYKGLPTDYLLPQDRVLWPQDPLRNVTWVLSQTPKPDIVILSYVSNDANLYPNYTKKETMDNLRLMFQSYNSAGIRCFVTSTQPRNDMSDAQRAMLRELRDSIINTFGLYAIIFWDDLITNDGLNMLKPEVNSGDGIHPNNLGHRLLFQRVQSRNIFSVAAAAPLPLLLKNWQARLEINLVKLNWNTAYEEPNTFFEVQRSATGKDFQTIYQKNGSGQNADYSWTDASPLNGKNFYRLRISEPSKTSYSRIIPIVNDKRQLIVSLYTDASQLHLQLNSKCNQSADLTIINYSGTVVKKQTFKLSSSSNIITIPILELVSGEYFLRIIAADGSTAVEHFARIK